MTDRASTAITPMSPVRQAKVRLAVNEHAEKMIREKFRHSHVASERELSRLPQFSIDEIIKGKFLGKGFFGMVYEVKGFNDSELDDGMQTSGMKHENEDNYRKWPRRTGPISQVDNGCRWPILRRRHTKPSTFNDFDVTLLPHQQMLMSATINDDADETKEVESPADRRTFMKQNCRRENKQARYAIKQLRPEILRDPTQLYYQGIMDLNSETRLLSCVQHPHIVKIRAIAKGKSTFDERYFIVLDRLYQVMEHRLKDWQRSHQRLSGFAGKRLWDRRGEKRARLWEERIVVAYDLASALAYLHSKRIIHRDLKNDNVGFDIRGDVKMFDFGLARELPRPEDANQDGAWKMTGSTGTPRMMANEVALDQPYNESCDTYSFCMLLWEILALKTPFVMCTPKIFKERIWRPPYKRPLVDLKWPKSIHILLQRGWSGNPKERHSMSHVAEILRKEVVACRDGNEHGLDHLERRSTFVFEDDDVKSQKSFMSMLSSPFSNKSPFRQSTKPSIGVVGSSTKDSALDGTQKTVISLTPSRLDMSGASVALSPTAHTGSSPRIGLPPMPVLFDDEDEDEDEIKNRNAKSSTEKTMDVTSIEDCRDGDGSRDDGDEGGEMLTSKDDDHHCAELLVEGTKISPFSESREQSIWDRLSDEQRRRERLRGRISRIQETTSGILIVP
jgi:serine/threonine protein kinase